MTLFVKVLYKIKQISSFDT